jgi:hypothetical protein
MTRFNDKTTMGGTENVFRTTCWIDVRKLKASNEVQRKIIISNLLVKYWKPVYCYLRRKGYGNEKAKDLTQGFFYDVILGQDLIQKADQSKGRFRTFLLTALSRYALNENRNENAQKRKPKEGFVSLDQLETYDLPEISTKGTADDIFNYTWASTLLDEVISKVEDEYCGSDKEIHWKVFEEKVINPIFNNAPPPPLAEICNKYNIRSESNVSNMLVTVKRRFRTVLKRHLQHFASSETAAVDEFNDLLKILSKSCAR